MDLRAIFFLGAGAACGALTSVTPAKYRWLPIALAAVYVVLAAASFLDSRSRRGAGPERLPDTPDQPNRPVM